MNQPAIVQQTPLTPPNVSLIAAAIAVEEADERWINGITYVPEGCGDADTVDICDNDPVDGFQKTVDNSATPISGTPFAIVASDTCTTSGFRVRDFQARATRMLLAIESFKLARELWEGGLGLNPFFTQPGLASTVATGVAPEDVLGKLEAAFYETSPAVRAMLHLSPRLLERLMYDSGGAALRREGNVYYTWMDSVVAVDKGYRGQGPSAASGEWAYITPIVTIRRGPIGVIPNNLSEATLRHENEITFFAERAIQATWDYNCQAYTVSVDLT